MDRAAEGSGPPFISESGSRWDLAMRWANVNTKDSVTWTNRSRGWRRWQR